MWVAVVTGVALQMPQPPLRRMSISTMLGFTRSLQLGRQRLGGQSRHRDSTASANPGARAHGGLYGLLQHHHWQHAFWLRGLDRLALSRRLLHIQGRVLYRRRPGMDEAYAFRV